MKIEINDEIADAIVAGSLKISLDCLSESINDLKKKKNKKKFEKEDLEDALLDFDGLCTAYYYYTGMEYKYVNNR